MKLLRLLLMLLLGGLLLGCSDSATDQKKAPLEPVKFVKIDDPKAFFADYLKTIKGDRFLPADLQKMLYEKTRMTFTEPLFLRHNPTPMLEWYYADDYLDLVRRRIQPDLEKMDYQLHVMKITPELAARIMMVVEAGPVQHKHQLQLGELQQSWKQLDANRYEVTLSRGDWSQLVGVGREAGGWKLRVLYDDNKKK